MKFSPNSFWRIISAFKNSYWFGELSSPTLSKQITINKYFDNYAPDGIESNLSVSKKTESLFISEFSMEELKKIIFKM